MEQEQIGLDAPTKTMTVQLKGTIVLPSLGGLIFRKSKASNGHGTLRRVIIVGPDGECKIVIECPDADIHVSRFDRVKRRKLSRSNLRNPDEEDTDTGIDCMTDGKLDGDEDDGEGGESEYDTEDDDKEGDGDGDDDDLDEDAHTSSLFSSSDADESSRKSNAFVLDAAEEKCQSSGELSIE